MQPTAGKDPQAEELRVRLAAIMEAADEGIIGKNLDGVITSWNRAAETIFGYTADEAIGSNISIIIPPERMQEEVEIIGRVKRGEQVDRYETVRRRKDGGKINISVTVSPLTDATSRIIGAAKIVRDLTDRRRVEEQFNASLQEIKNLKAALDEHAIVAITDSAGRITYVNDKFCAISKYSRDELLGQDHRIINSGYHSKEFFRNLWTTIGRGGVWKGEIRNRAKDGSYYWVDTTIVPFLNADGKPGQYVAIRADITVRKQAEGEIQRLNEQLSERVRERTAQLEAVNKELEAFSYSVSHDLRAPLRHVAGFVGLLEKSAGAGLDDKSRHYLCQISDSAKQMGRLVDDLLVFSRMGRAEVSRAKINLQELTERVISELEPETEGRSITWKKTRLTEVRADPSLLHQVLFNLIENALKYTRTREKAEIEIGCREEAGGEVVVFVRDNGVGFEMAYAGKLFGVFQRLHQEEDFEGTGIGLANVRQIINRHGGRTWAEGECNRGATFYISLPGANTP